MTDRLYHVIYEDTAGQNHEFGFDNPQDVAQLVSLLLATDDQRTIREIRIAVTTMPERIG